MDQKIIELKDDIDKYQRDITKLTKENEKIKAEKKKNTSFIKGNQTAFISPKDIPIENKENSQHQM